MSKIANAVLISDVHYNINTLVVADAAMRLAIAKANELGVPLVVCGDLHDTKAHIRGECIKAMLETFSLCEQKPYVMVGNHDRINEKSLAHSLEFLRSIVNIVEENDYCTVGPARLLAYFSDPQKLKKELASTTEQVVIMHQGVGGSISGEYIHDKTALRGNDLAGFRVISGHYHNRQQFKLPDGGLMDYVGNPYTLTFGEANDPPKGFQVLYNDGSMDFVPTHLRCHVVIDNHVSELSAIPYSPASDDIIWFKLRGPSDQLATVTKKLLADNYGIRQSFKLDLIPTDAPTTVDLVDSSHPAEHILDALIDSMSDTMEDRKTRLKALWRAMVSN